jgi:hypothetical protein
VNIIKWQSYTIMYTGCDLNIRNSLSHYAILHVSDCAKLYSKHDNSSSSEVLYFDEGYVGSSVEMTCSVNGSTHHARLTCQLNTTNMEETWHGDFTCVTLGKKSIQGIVKQISWLRPYCNACVRSIVCMGREGSIELKFGKTVFIE